LVILSFEIQKSSQRRKKAKALHLDGATAYINQAGPPFPVHFTISAMRIENNAEMPVYFKHFEQWICIFE
jgi:hypothetical protein